jgi:hypothetical protein
MDIYIGLTLLTPLGADAVIGGLVRRGYQVAPAQLDEPMGQFLTLRVSNDTDDDDDGSEEYGPEVLGGIHTALKEVLQASDSKFFSYVIFAGDVVSVWAEGNLKLAPEVPKGKTMFDHLASGE